MYNTAHALYPRIHKAVSLLRVRREHQSHCRHAFVVFDSFLNDDGTTAFACGNVTRLRRVGKHCSVRRALRYKLHRTVMALAGIPIRLLHEAESHVITVELKNSEIYRGMLLRGQDNMNLEMTTVTHTARDGQVQKMEQVYIRGSQIRYIVVPDLLKKAPMFSHVSNAGKQIQEANRFHGHSNKRRQKKESEQSVFVG